MADECPRDAELRDVVKQLQHGRIGGASKMRAEDIKQWLRGIIDEEENGSKGAGENW